MAYSADLIRQVKIYIRFRVILPLCALHQCAPLVNPARSLYLAIKYFHVERIYFLSFLIVQVSHSYIAVEKIHTLKSQVLFIHLCPFHIAFILFNLLTAEVSSSLFSMSWYQSPLATTIQLRELSTVQEKTTGFINKLSRFICTILKFNKFNQRCETFATKSLNLRDVGLFYNW